MTAAVTGQPHLDAWQARDAESEQAYAGLRSTRTWLARRTSACLSARRLWRPVAPASAACAPPHATPDLLNCGVVLQTAFVSALRLQRSVCAAVGLGAATQQPSVFQWAHLASPDATEHVPRVVLDMAPRPDGLKEAELKTLREMGTMVTKRLEADMAGAARARAKDDLLRSLDFVRAPFALCTLAPDGRLKIRYANSSWVWEAGALRAAAPACLPATFVLLLLAGVA